MLQANDTHEYEEVVNKIGTLQQSVVWDQHIWSCEYRTITMLE